MRTRPETVLIIAMLVFAITGVTALFLDDVRLGAHDPVTVIEPGEDPALAQGIDHADAWFAAVRPYCNPVEVETRRNGSGDWAASELHQPSPSQAPRPLRSR